MKYKLYYNGDKCLLYNTDLLYTLNMYNPTGGSSCSVETGGSIQLSNGDILYINEQYGPLYPWGPDDEYYGIGISLESGHATISYLMLCDNVGNWPQVQESGYGCFFDLSEYEYDEGNILRIYDLEVDDLYDMSPMPEGMYWHESAWLEYGVSCIGVLVIRNGNWELTTESRYIGKTLTLSSGEDIFVSGPSMEDGIGVYFTLDSGRVNTSYYIRDGEILAHSSYNWFSPMIPEDGDEIHIYIYDEDEDYSEFGWDTPWWDEDYISELIPCLCKLIVVNGEWTILEDHSDD